VSEPGEETTRARLGTYPLDPRASLPNSSASSRSVHWSETGGNGWGYRGHSRGAGWDRDRTSVVVQMNFGGRFYRESRLIYQELLRTPPIVLLILSCLAVLLVGAIVVGATR
jgi:hypothetical protein